MPSSAHPAIVQQPQEDKEFTTASGESWLTGWTYRKRHDISGSAGAGTNYTIRIRVWYDEAITSFASNGVGQPTNEMSRPQGFYFNDVTYIAWQGGDSTPDVFVIAYDHTSETWSDSTNVAPTGLTDNAHAAPVIVVNSTGHIHLFWGYHNTALKHYVSDDAEDISSFTQQTDIIAAPSYTGYPHVVSHQDTMHLFYSITDSTGAVVSRRVYVKNSTNGGVTWGSGQLILNNYTEGDGWGVYQTPVAYGYGDRIDMTWTYVEVDAGIPDSFRRHIYHAYYNTTDSNMYNASGYDLGETITRIEANDSCMVENTGTGYDVAGYPQLTVDSNNYPWIVYTKGEKTTDADEHWGNFTSYSEHWNGTAWNGPYTITTTGHFANSHAIRYITSTYSDVYIIKSKSLEADGEQDQDYGGDLTKYNWNGSQWLFVKTMLTEASAGYDLNYPNIPYNATSELFLLFCESDPAIYTGDMRVYVAAPVTGYASETSTKANGKTDFSDLRFTDNDGSSLLPYWIAEKEDSNYALVWVKVSDSLSVEVTIYMYYGNDGASSLSDASAVMEFYDDGTTTNFENDTAGDASWTHYDSKLNLTEDSIDDAAVVGIVDPNIDLEFNIRVDEHSGIVTTNQILYGWYDEDLISEYIGTVASLPAKRRFMIWRNAATDSSEANSIRVAYMNTGDTLQFWNGATGWAASSSNWHSANGTINIVIWSDGTNFKCDVLSNDVSVFIGAAGKPSIAISSVKSFSSGQCFVVAEPYTDAYYLNLTAPYFFGRNRTTTEPVQGNWWMEEEEGEQEEPPTYTLYCKVYDEDTTSYVDESADANDPDVRDVPLLEHWSETPEVNDAIYFGSSVKFTGLIFDISGQGVGDWTISWEYYNASSSSWAALEDVDDETDGFYWVYDDGLYVLWTTPLDWGQTSVDGDTYYWVRARVSWLYYLAFQPKADQIYRVRYPPIEEEALWALDTAIIILGLIMVPASALYLVRGRRKDLSMDKLYYALIVFFLGCALFIGGIMP